MSLQQILVIYVVGMICSFVLQIRLTKGLFRDWPSLAFWEDVGTMIVLLLFWPILTPVFLVNVAREKWKRYVDSQ